MGLNFKIGLANKSITHCFYLKISIVWILVACLPNLSSCQLRGGLPGSRLRSIENPPIEVRLQLKGEVGRTWQLEYVSRSITRDYQGAQLVRDREEFAQFRVEQTHLRGTDANSLFVSMKTLHKEGVLNLRDLALPELGEEIVFQYTPQAQVLSAGPYPPGSLFFVPPVPLPLISVSKGDSWEHDSFWVGAESNVPLKLSTVAILKDFVSCGSEVCARIEISGEVGLFDRVPVDARFDSQIRGEFLFSLESGDVLWSELKGFEWMVTSESSSKIYSCTSMRVKQPNSIFHSVQNLSSCIYTRGELIDYFDSH